MSQQQKTLWKPKTSFINNSNLKQFEQWLQNEKGLSFDNYEELWQWSIDQIEDFWESIAQYFGVIFHVPYQQVLDTRVMPGAKWFEGATLNYAEHIFRQQTTQRPALIFQNELEKRRVSWEELSEQVKAIQQFLQQQGIQKGDCVAGYLPNIPEAVACFLAVNSLGAVWTCCSPDFGEPTVIERFSQIQPKLLLAVDGYNYNGKGFSRLDAIHNIRKAIPSIEQTLFIPYLDKTATLENNVTWAAVLNGVDVNKAIEFTSVSFSHPIWVAS